MTGQKQNNGRAKLNAVPTAGGGITRAAFTCMTQAGLDGRPLLKRAGLSAQQMANPRNSIAVKNQIKFLNLAADELEDEFLGVHLAQRVDLRELGLLYYVQAS